VSRGELIERIAALAEGQGGILDPRMIARDFLRLSAPDGKGAAGLVRALLAQDPRFVEQGDGRWAYRPAGSGTLDPPVLLVGLRIPRGTDREPWQWLAFATLWGKPSRIRQHRGTRPGPELDEMLALLREVPAATEKPGALGRWIGAQERLHALPEVEPEIIDLRAWGRMLAEETAPASGAPDPAAGLETPEDAGCAEHLARLSAALAKVEGVARARGLRCWREVALAPGLARAAADEEVWSSARAFGQEHVEALPEEPGIYRFFDREGRILYVGKSANLRRRVLSYFRPLGLRSIRRGELLDQLHRFETQTTSSELDALILELQEIRRHRPAWNVQVDLGPEETRFAQGDRALLLFLPGVQAAGTLYALDGERAARSVLAAPCDPAPLERGLECFYQGAPCEPLTEIPAPERTLVRRWLVGKAHGGVILRIVEFESFGRVARAVSALAAGDQGEDAGTAPGWILRDRRGPPSA
jgi:hypothetical protein